MMGVSLGLDADQVMVADVVRRLCAKHSGQAGTVTAAFSRNLWRELAALGVFALASVHGTDGGAPELVAAAEELGRAGFPGPVAATVAALRLLPANLCEPVLAGEHIVSLGEAPLMPWGTDADVFIGLADGRAALLDVSAREAVETLGGESWASVVASTVDDLGPMAEARLWYDVVLGAQLVGAGLGLVESAAAHANSRRQFGQAISGFQGVSFPLAQAVIGLESAQLLLRAAAVHLQQGIASRARLALSARLSASRAARQAAFCVHQVFGAIGATADGPVFWLSRRIQQWTVQAPSDRDAWRNLAARDIGDHASVLLSTATPSDRVCNSN